MNTKRLFQIIKEEIENWFDDEPSIADKYYLKKLGIKPSQPKEKPILSGELIGYIDRAWTSPIAPVAIYKNPQNLNGFNNNSRGVLTQDGDIYVAENENGLHYNILELLVKKDIIPSSSLTHNYDKKMPEEFITIDRKGGNTFAQSEGYDEFPEYYEAMFDYANEMQPYKFVVFPFN